MISTIRCEEIPSYGDDSWMIDLLALFFATSNKNRKQSNVTASLLMRRPFISRVLLFQSDDDATLGQQRRFGIRTGLAVPLRSGSAAWGGHSTDVLAFHRPANTKNHRLSSRPMSIGHVGGESPVLRLVQHWTPHQSDTEQSTNRTFAEIHRSGIRSVETERSGVLLLSQRSIETSTCLRTAAKGTEW